MTAMAGERAMNLLQQRKAPEMPLNLPMDDTTGFVILTAEFTALPGTADIVAELLDGLAAMVRREEGNMAFDCYRRVEDAAKFVVFEIYRNREAFERHLAADYGAVFNSRLQKLIVEPHSILTFLNPVRT